VAAREQVEREAAEQEGDGPKGTLVAQPPAPRSSTLPYVVGAAGLASIGTGVALIYWGRRDNAKLGECVTPEANCAQSAVDHVHRMYLAGNVALGVGVAALGAAYFLHVRSSAAQERETQEAYRLDLLPTQSGAVAAVSGSF
jgi:hypothetical protein